MSNSEPIIKAAAVLGFTVVVNAGKDKGVEKGHKFRIAELMPIYGPDSHEKLGDVAKSPEVIFHAVRVYDRMAETIVTIGDRQAMRPKIELGTELKRLSYKDANDG